MNIIKSIKSLWGGQEPNGEIPYTMGVMAFPELVRHNLYGDMWQPSYPWLIYNSQRDIVYTCMNIRSTNAAKAEPLLYERTAQDKYKLVKLHNGIIDIFENPQPENPDYTWSDLIRQFVINLDGLGNVYIWKQRSSYKGYPIGYYILPVYDNSFMIPKFDSNNKLTHWEYSPNGVKSDKTIYPANDIIHWKTHVLSNDFYGRGKLAAASNIINIKNALQDYQYKYLKNDATAKKYFATDLKFKKEEFDAFEEAFMKKYGGNARSTVFLTGGWKDIGGSDTPKDMDYNNSLKFMLTQVLGVFEIPETFVSITENANRAIDTNSLKKFNNMVIDSILREFDRKITKDLQREFKHKNLYLWHKLELPAEEKLQISKAAEGRAAGTIKINEHRKLIGLDDLTLESGEPDPRGEQLVSPAKFANVKIQDDSEPGSPEETIDDKEL